MKIWLLDEECIYIPLEGKVLVDDKLEKLQDMPALLLNCLIDAKTRKGSDVLSMNEIAEIIWGDHEGWDGSRQEAFKKLLAKVRIALHDKDRGIIKPSGQGYKLTKDIREYPEFLDTAEGKRLFSTKNRLLFYVNGNPQPDSLIYKYVNDYGDRLDIVYSKPWGWRLLNFRYWSINLNKTSLYHFAYGLRKGIIKSVKLNKKTLGFNHMISYGLNHDDAFCFIQDSLFVMEEWTSYEKGKEQFIKYYTKSQEHSKNNDSIDAYYLSQWYKIVDFAEHRLLNEHDSEGLVILSWLYSVGFIDCIDLHYPELVLLYIINLRDEIEQYFSYTAIEDFNKMIDDICNYFDCNDTVDIYISKNELAREEYLNDIRLSYLSRQPLSFDNNREIDSLFNYYPTMRLETLFKISDKVSLKVEDLTESELTNEQQYIMTLKNEPIIEIEDDILGWLSDFEKDCNDDTTGSP